MILNGMITDRTSQDVENRTSKGVYNAADLNRVERACRIIADELRAAGYSIPIVTKTDWTMQDYPKRSDIDRIRSNVELLRDKFYSLTGSPLIRYWNSMDWGDANDLEKTLVNADILLQRMMEGFRHVGQFTAVCGKGVILP